MPSSTGVTSTRVGHCVVVTVTQDLGDGVMDALRRVLLDGVQIAGASAAILDLSAVPFMDSTEFAQVRAALRMAELLGARTMLVGLQPGIIVHLLSVDADVAGVRASVGLEEALQAMQAGAKAGDA